MIQMSLAAFGLYIDAYLWFHGKSRFWNDIPPGIPHVSTGCPIMISTGKVYFKLKVLVQIVTILRVFKFHKLLAFTRILLLNWSLLKLYNIS